ncbi:hypothetical protein [Streptomyces sp. NRRL F-2799]|uniref:hypothetical protein n=1 Tax=Streptomyces sp. NRRL F-2799 TaxID=1463844 RepID=UPI00131A55F4|nr:hypothetical protein [Streptomyces sp. NRRL F-2799]
MTNGIGCSAWPPRARSPRAPCPAWCPPPRRPPPLAPSGPGARQHAFAAAKYQVPARVLRAVSYQESAWDAHAGQMSTSGRVALVYSSAVTATGG